MNSPPCKYVTYSRSVTVVLTRSCANECLYCGFRREGDGLIRVEDMDRTLRWALREGVSEVLVMAGERAQERDTVRRALQDRGFSGMAAWAAAQCERILQHGLLPHVNIGLLRDEEMAQLSEVCASMGLMMEGDYGGLSRRINPGKVFRDRLAHLCLAGQRGIPFTTGLLLGVGETHAERLKSLQAIAGCARRYGHVQEIILQPYRPGPDSRIEASPITLEDLAGLAEWCRRELPDVHLQIPPNLHPRWPELIPLGFDDLGGIGLNGDAVNPLYAWPSVEHCRRLLMKSGYLLRPRLPLYPMWFQQGIHAPRLKPVLERWITNHEEYRYYSEGD